MIDLAIKPIPYFTLREIMCPCGCGLIILQREVLMAEYQVRMRYGRPIIATSWVRCRSHNAAVGGKDDSYHIPGKAVDQKPANEPMNQDFAEICREYYPFVLVYEWGCHSDVRGDRSL